MYPASRIRRLRAQHPRQTHQKASQALAGDPRRNSRENAQNFVRFSATFICGAQARALRCRMAPLFQRLAPISSARSPLRPPGGWSTRVAAGVPIVFGSGATSAEVSHGKQADQFRYYTKWGRNPAQALQTAYLNAAAMLNYGWIDQIGSIEKGKFADIIAVSGNPLNDITEMERVKFVMKGGVVVRNELKD